jgi:hypothetical protein
MSAMGFFVMAGKDHPVQPKELLSDDDRMHITEIFNEDIVPRLMSMDARIGNINCEFAGDQYKNWVIEFRSNRFGFEIVDFEYDEDSRGFQLAPRRKPGQTESNVSE